MSDNQSIKNFLDYKWDGRKIWNEMKDEHRILEVEKRRIKWISHRKVLDSFTKQKKVYKLMGVAVTKAGPYFNGNASPSNTNNIKFGEQKLF